MKQGGLKPDGYRPRIADAQVSRLLDTFGAVEIAGPMWCWKTWTSLSFAASVSRLGRTAERVLAEADPTAALLGDQPRAIDEWQDVPEVWDEVRHRIDDAGSQPGQFILTRSSEPRKDRLRHSGAGRIATYRMSTMTLAEMGASSGTVSLSGLFEGSFTPQLVHQGLETYANLICKGGWPALLATPPDAMASGKNGYVENYLSSLFNVSLARRGLDAGIGRRVAMSLARNLGQAAKYSTIAQDAEITAASEKEEAAIASMYVAELVRLYVVDEVLGWDALIRSKSRLRVKPKRYFADPSIPAALLGASRDRIMKDGKLFGLLVRIAGYPRPARLFIRSAGCAARPAALLPRRRRSRSRCDYRAERRQMGRDRNQARREQGSRSDRKPRTPEKKGCAQPCGAKPCAYVHGSPGRGRRSRAPRQEVRCVRDSPHLPRRVGDGGKFACTVIIAAFCRHSPVLFTANRPITRRLESREIPRSVPRSGSYSTS